MSLYYKILLGALALPFILSFDKKVAFFRRWKYLFPAMILTAAVFIPWDILFTDRGVWGFNSEYLQGTRIFHLPVEEWLFFIVIPYASVFTFDVVQAYFPGLKNRSYYKYAGIFMIVATGLLIIIFPGGIYTISAGLLTVFLVLLLQFFLRVSWLNEFYMAYLFILLPFAIINGILTGTGIEGEVVWYSAEGMGGPRAGTIPLEDFFYGFSLILMNLGFYNYFRKKATW